MPLRRLWLIVFALFFLPSIVLADPEPLFYPEWEWVYDGPAGARDLLNDMVCDSEGNIFITGESDGVDTSRDLVLFKLQPDGQLLWDVRYDGTNHGLDYGAKVVVDQSGYCTVLGAEQGYAIIRQYNGLGELEWSVKEESNCYIPTETTLNVSLDADDNLDFCYSLHNSNYNPGSRWRTKKYSADGVPQWEDTIESINYSDNVPFFLTQDDAGNLYAAGMGYDYDNNDYNDVLIRKMNADGVEQWRFYHDIFDLQYSNDDYVHYLVVDDQQNVYFTGSGEMYDPSMLNCYSTFTGKLNANGQLVWSNIYPAVPTEGNGGWGLWLDEQGNMYVWSANSIENDKIIKYDADGNQVWVHEIEAGDGEATFLRTFISQPGDGNYFSGYIKHADSTYSSLLIKFDFNGNELWRMVYSQSPDINYQITTMALDGANNIYLGFAFRDVTVKSNLNVAVMKISPCYGCVIDYECYDDGAVDPENVCHICAVDQTRTEWTNNDGVACGDGLFCNGVDECSGGACDAHAGDPCDDNGLFCDGAESCDEENDQCVSAGNPCDDNGVFCDGEELCDEANDLCYSAGDPCADNGLFCDGVESCNEQQDWCEATGNPCSDNGLFCDGVELCDETLDLCYSTGYPCDEHSICVEDTDSCDPMTTDDDTTDDDTTDDDTTDDDTMDDDTSDDDTTDDDTFDDDATDDDVSGAEDDDDDDNACGC